TSPRSTSEPSCAGVLGRGAENPGQHDSVRDNGRVAELVVVAGLSGAGRTTAANTFEDLGWYVIDNLPPELIPQVTDLARRADTSSGGRIVLVVGRRGAVGEELLAAVEALRGGPDRVSLVFLDAPDDVLVRRFEDRRRRHPLATTEDQR